MSRSRHTFWWGMLVGIVVAAAYVAFVDFVNATGAIHRSLTCAGQGEDYVLATLGAPMEIVDGAEKMRTELRDIASSYEPDPPQHSADKLWVYRVQLRLLVLYWKDGTVRWIWTGLT